MTFLGASLRPAPSALVSWLSMCQQSPVLSALRASTPLAEAARRVIAPAEIKKRDKQWLTGVISAEAAWLSGPIWRHCKGVARVDFHWELDTHRVAGMLDGYRSPVRPTAQDLLQQLDPDTITQLAELIAARKGRGEPAS